MLNSKYQSAYRKNYSCETSVIKVVNDILWNMENGKITALVTIDLSAAFDTVDHEILLAVLDKMYGIKEKALDWYSSFLQDRKFKVCINNEYSSIRTFNYLVAQGSYSGPALFCLYSSSLPQIISPNLKISAFAVDHTIYHHFNPNDSDGISDTKKELEENLLKVNNWMKENRLKMNTGKTEFIKFGSVAQLSKCEIDFKDIKVVEDVVDNSSVIRLLGAWLDNNLTLNQHVTKKCRAASWNLQKIKSIRQYIDMDMCKLLVDSLVTSHLDYCNCILSGAYGYVIRKLERIQNQSAKLILGKNKYYSSTEAKRELHWLPIAQWIKFKIMLLVHKCLNMKGPCYLNDLLCKNFRRDGLHSKGTGNTCRLIEPYVKHKTFASRSFSVMGPKLWNDLPNYIKEQSDTDTFKKLLKTHLSV